MFRMFSFKDYIRLCVVKFTHSVTNILLPVLVWYFLLGLSEDSTIDHYSTLKYVVCICVVTMVKGISQHHSFFWSGMCGMQMSSAVIGLVYKKILTMNRRTLNDVITGQTINMVSNDANHLKNAGWSMLFLVFSPFEILTSGVLLWYLVGWQALIGAGFYLVVIMYISLMSRIAGHFHEKAVSITDKRLEIMNEIIAGIRAVKMNAWEWNFNDIITGIRKNEISCISWRGAIISSFDALYFTNTNVAVFLSVTFLLYTNACDHLTAFQIFTLVSTLNVIRFSVSVSMGETLHILADARVSLERIQNFLQSASTMNSPENYIEKSKRCENSQLLHDKLSRQELDTCSSSPCISLKNVSCSWNEKEGVKTLQNISMNIYNKQLIAITGPVGCGKSSILQVILNELPHQSGEIECSGSIAYYPQLPWVFSGTVRENITFGKSFDAVRYQKIVNACSLQKDLQQLPNGDLTNIGQRGVSLSGGQRARTCLARTLYTNADIILLDDLFSAVDARVANHLFKECIQGLLSEKCRILVTHHHQFLKSVDSILILKEGKLVEQGKYEELQSKEVLSKPAEVVGKETTNRGSFKHCVRHASLRRTGTSTSLVSQGAIADLKEDEEERMVGSVTWTLYWQYFRSAYPTVILLGLFMLVLFVQVVLISPHWWLSKIAEMSFSQQRSTVTLGIYGSLVVGALFLSAVVSFLFYYTLLHASENLHNKMVTAVMQAPVLFFDTNPVGRILNRFSKDIGCMDDTIPPQFLLAVQLCLFTIGATLLSAVTNYWLLIGIIPLIVLFVYFGSYYLKTSRELRRMEAIKCSPVYSHIADTVSGLEVIRSSRMEKDFLQELFKYQDQNTSVNIMVLGCSKWLSVRLEMLCSLLVTLVAAGAVFVTQIPAIAGLSLTYAMETLDAAQFGVQLTSEIENLMTSVERVVTYSQLTPEDGYTARDDIPTSSWPSKGDLLLQNLSLTYVDGGRRVLKDITFEIKQKEKIGVVGRTGSGKSSIVSAIFRMPEPDGEVTVDGINLKRLDLQSARQTFSVITQDPVLFAGTLRSNLDPFNKNTDHELWTALEEAQMKQWVCQLPGQLQHELIESGNNISVGERQLLCLARVLLEKRKIVILDEATANVDFKTDRLIQEVIRTKFKDTTVISIAHRLDTIVDCDRVMVLDEGRVIEFDRPSSLLNRRGSHFAELARSSNNSFS